MEQRRVRLQGGRQDGRLITVGAAVTDQLAQSAGSVEVRRDKDEVRLLKGATDAEAVVRRDTRTHRDDVATTALSSHTATRDRNGLAGDGTS